MFDTWECIRWTTTAKLPKQLPVAGVMVSEPRANSQSFMSCKIKKAFTKSEIYQEQLLHGWRTQLPELAIGIDFLSLPFIISLLLF